VQGGQKKIGLLKRCFVRGTLTRAFERWNKKKEDQASGKSESFWAQGRGMRARVNSRIYEKKGERR